MILVTALVTALDWGASDSHALIADAVVAALLLAPRVLVRREVAAVLGYLARSSLFAYLTQGITIHLLRDRLGITGVAPNVVAALTVGALAYAAWERLTRRLGDGAAGARAALARVSRRTGGVARVAPGAPLPPHTAVLP